MLFSIVKVKLLSHVQLFATPWTVSCQAPLSMGFPGKNTGVGCHFLLQGIFLTQGSKLGLPTLNHLGHQGISAVFHSEGPYVSNLWILTAFLYVPDTCSAQSCPMLCDLMDCSPPGSSVHRIFWARILKWVAISYSRGLPYLTYNSNSF